VGTLSLARLLDLLSVEVGQMIRELLHCKPQRPECRPARQEELPSKVFLHNKRRRRLHGGSQSHNKKNGWCGIENWGRELSGQ